jgi:hypothetical protein
MRSGVFALVLQILKEMKRTLAITIITSVINYGALAQNKAVVFSNITEATVGLQLGKTVEVNSFTEGESKLKVAAFKVPSPRISSSFGMLVKEILFLGPGVAYMYQPGDEANPFQHHISAYGHMRVHFAKGKLRPYTEFKGGYNHIFAQKVSSIYSADAYTWDGVFFEPALGLAVKLGDHALLNASLGFQLMNVWNRSEGMTSLDAFGPEMKHRYQRLLLSAGFSFY